MELAIPVNRGIQAPIFQPIPPSSYFNKEPVPAPIVDTTGASAMAGKAALYGSISKVLSELPETLLKSYNEGRKFKVGNEVAKQYDEALANPAGGQLSNFAATGEGDLKFSPQDAEIRKLKIQELQANAGTLYDRITKGGVGQPGQLSAMPEPSSANSAALPVPHAVAVNNPPSKPLALSNMPVPGEEGLDTSMLPSADFQPVGKDASKLALAEMETTGVKKMADGTLIETFPGGKQRALSPRDPDHWVDVTEKPQKDSPTENALNRAIIARGKNPVAMTTEEKESFLKNEVPLKPSEKLSATRDLRQAYETLPSKTVLFGKGQMPGLDQVIERLDEIKKTAGDDFKNLTPQQARTFVFQFSKFNDPNSAVMLGEYKAAADTLGLLDKFQQALNKASTGEGISAAQAQDIYSTIKAAHERAKTNYVLDTKEILSEGKALGVHPRRLGIPSRGESWITGAPEETAIPGVEEAAKEPVKEPVAPSVANLAPKDAEALSWANANPADPRSAAIKAALRLKGVQ